VGETRLSGDAASSPRYPLAVNHGARIVNLSLEFRSLDGPPQIPEVPELDPLTRTAMGGPWAWPRRATRPSRGESPTSARSKIASSRSGPPPTPVHWPTTPTPVSVLELSQHSERRRPPPPENAEHPPPRRRSTPPGGSPGRERPSTQLTFFFWWGGLVCFFFVWGGGIFFFLFYSSFSFRMVHNHRVVIVAPRRPDLRFQGPSMAAPHVSLGAGARDRHGASSAAGHHPDSSRTASSRRPRPRHAV